MRPRLVLLACLLLAEQTALVDVQSAQRVERRTVIQWCVVASGAYLERRTVMLVDGKEAGKVETERIFDLKAENAWLIPGGY